MFDFQISQPSPVHSLILYESVYYQSLVVVLRSVGLHLGVKHVEALNSSGFVMSATFNSTFCSTRFMTDLPHSTVSLLSSHLCEDLTTYLIAS